MQNNGVYEQAAICVQLAYMEPTCLSLSCVWHPIKKAPVFILTSKSVWKYQWKNSIEKTVSICTYHGSILHWNVRNIEIISKNTASNYTKKVTNLQVTF